MSTFHLEIVTPTKVYDLGQVSYLRAPGVDGSFGVLARHTPALFALDVGEIKVTMERGNEFLATSGGYAEITGNKVQMLVETVERANEIDKARAEAALQRAKDRFTEAEKDEERNEKSLARAMNRLKVSGH